MGKKILVIQGHPDTSTDHLCHVLASSYIKGAQKGKHEIRTIRIAIMDFPILRSKKQWENTALSKPVENVQKDIEWANHLVLFFPLWLGGMPALTKGFLEQVARPDFAFSAENKKNPFAHKKLSGRSARLVVTMGMPAFVYRFYFKAHSIKALKRNILGFIGIKPIRNTLFGGVDNLPAKKLNQWRIKLEKLGMNGK
ncbi:NAD(P)H-dependent oxidoreductase [Marinicella sp. W31]|uniref:NAD(P)H-dependent oxidoreductase n=1 Tax=Marinicella sp. W31 TaxID=3023713 RepID=UPI003756408F